MGWIITEITKNEMSLKTLNNIQLFLFFLFSQFEYL